MRNTRQQTKPLAISSIADGFKIFACNVGIITILFASNISGQITGGGFEPQKQSISDKADKNLRSIARVNPSTLAMEFSLPLMNYPGRGGNSLPVSLNYSSKLWEMKSAHTWWYPYTYDDIRYVTDAYTKFAEHSASGWTSSLQPPRLDTEIETYNYFGKPYGDSLDVGTFNSEFSTVRESLRHGNAPVLGIYPATCSFQYGYGGIWKCKAWKIGWKDTPDPFDSPDPTVQTPIPNYIYYVKRLRIVMPDGSSHEFRQNDNIINCGEPMTGCSMNYDGTYLSTDGSGMRLEYDDNGSSTLYLPNGDKYTFPAAPQSINGHFAEAFFDADGNKTSFSEVSETTTEKFIQKTTDTLGRVITEPIPHNWETQNQIPGTEQISLPGFNGETQDYSAKWDTLKPEGCEESTSAGCVGQNQQTGGALEEQTQKLWHETRYFCQGSLKQDLLASPNDYNDPANEVLFPASSLGIRPCTGFNVPRDSSGEAIMDQNGNPILNPARFNPVVLSEITLPNDKKYVFKYNRFGEISKIVYPTGSYETFIYGHITPLVFSPYSFAQTNRGVTQRKVYNSSGVLEQEWNYSATLEGSYPNTTYKVTSIAPKADNPTADGIKTERFLHLGGGGFGFSDARAGMPYDERTYDELGAFRSRTLTEYITKESATGMGFNATRDLRTSRSISVGIEGNQALATMSESLYDENGNADPSYFSHLNLKQSKTHHYKSIDLTTAQNGTFSQIAALFSGATPATISETDYVYDANYKVRGISSLPTESRILNPANTSDVLVKTQTVYDESSYLVGDSGTLTGNLAGTWVNPNTNYRAKPTTAKVWNKDTTTWIQTHAQYDQYGNVRKAWDASGDATRFAETEYSSTYGFAYPTKVIAPAPDPTDTHGTNQTSTSEMTYDFTTGLSLKVKDDFGQEIQTEYNDSMLRPTRVFGVGSFVIPITETIYDDTNLTVKVRKQIDPTNWDEAISYMDSLGRTYKTQIKDSQGDVFGETEYDFLGRVKRATNPYRNGDTIYWSKPRYDELGRAVESFAPAVSGQTGASLGITSYSISDVPNFVGTVVTSTDASGRKSRAITNALGQLLRVDEPTATGGTPDNDLGSLSSPNQPTFYTYSPQGKMVKVEQGGQSRYFKYDSLGRLIRVKQPEQEANDSLDLADAYNTSGKWSAKFTYDVLGNVLTTTDAKDTVITNTYDKASRVITRTYSGEIGVTTPAVSFKYDGKGLDTPQSPNFAKGKLTYVNNTISQTRYLMFDNLGRLTSSEQRTPVNDETIATAAPRISLYEYNLSGALLKETYPSGRVVQNEFESDGDLSRIYGKANTNATERTYANSFSYMPDGRIEKLKLGNGLWESAKFNNRLQVTEFNLGIGVNDASKWKLQYEYGELNADGTVDTNKNTGNIAKQISSFAGLTNPFVQSFKYDSLFRLIEAKETVGTNPTPTWKQNFGYDRFGNRISFTDEINGQVQTNTNLTHPLIDANTNRFNTGQGYVFDKNGNLTTSLNPDNSSQSRTFTFNGENKQTEVKDAYGNPIGQYFYDGEGKRVKKVVPSTGETTVFVYSNGKLVAEYSTQTPPTNPTTSYTMTDQLDSPRVITNALGEVTSRRDFKPFGEEVPPDGTHRTAPRKYGVSDNIRQKFTGYQKDTETQLDFAEARMYQNLHGRFTAVDPLLASGKSANPQTFNRYVYVLNNPLVLTDPSGLQAGSWYVSRTETKTTISVVWDVFKSNPGGNWKPVNFGGGNSVLVRNTCIQGTNCGSSVYLYRDGTSGLAKIQKTKEEVQAEREKAILQAKPKTELQLMIYESTLVSGAPGFELKGPVAHVAWGVTNRTFSWDQNGYKVQDHPSFQEYLAYNATYRTGTLYDLNFGSEALNAAAAEEVMNGPRNGYSGYRFFGSGYNIFSNNCGETIDRVIERLNLPADDSLTSFAPWNRQQYVENNWQQFIQSQRRFGPPPPVISPVP